MIGFFDNCDSYVSFWILRYAKNSCLVYVTFFLKYFWWTHTLVLFWGHWYPCFRFLVMFPLGFKARVGSTLCAFAQANVVYIPWDLPLVLHLPPSWQPAWLSVASLHASAVVGVGSGSNGKSPAQKMNTLPLCQRPGLVQVTWLWSSLLLTVWWWYLFGGHDPYIFRKLIRPKF